MKKLLLLPILLFAFNALAMDYLKEAEELFERSEASKVEETSQSPFALRQEEHASSSSDKHGSDSKDYTWHSDLNEQQWTERYGCKYCPKGGCLKSEMFDCKGLLKNPYWQKVLKMSQAEKDDVLAQMMKEPERECDFWHHWKCRRCHIAAAVCAGASPDTKSKSKYWERPLSSVVHRDPDPALTQLLLEHGADPELNISRFDKEPAICSVRTLREAKLLHKHEANLNVSCAFMEYNPIHSVLLHKPKESAELIDFFLDNGVEPNERNGFGETTLHNLADAIHPFSAQEMHHIGCSLVEHGVDLNAKVLSHRSRGKTAEEILIERQWNNIECISQDKNYCQRDLEGIEALLEVIRETKER